MMKPPALIALTLAEALVALFACFPTTHAGGKEPDGPAATHAVGLPVPTSANAPRLITVSISPEARVKAEASSESRKLRQGEWTEFGVVVENAAGITAPLAVECAQAMTSADDASRERWLRLELLPAGPLSGAPEERRTLRLWSRDAGRRAAVLHFNAGQGTQDLGFRSDVLVTFDAQSAGSGDAKPVAPATDPQRAEATALFERFKNLLMNAPSDAQADIIALCVEVNSTWFSKPDAPAAVRAALLEKMRSLNARAPDVPRPGPRATLRGITLEGGTGARTPSRVWVKGSDGVFRHANAFAANATLSSKPVLPLVFAGKAASYALPFFYCDGAFEVEVPPGRTEIVLERGFEHPLVSEIVELRAGETRDLTLKSSRFLDMKAAGWISGDTHIHWAKNHWSEDEEIALLKLVQRAEDLRVANNLTLKHHTIDQNFIAPAQFPMGPIPGLCDAEYHAQMAEEWRNEEFYGHLVLLNIQRLINPISTGSMGGRPHFWDWPDNQHAIRETRAQGGLVIEAHGLGRNANVPVDVALRFADSLDQIEPDDYYRFLDCGFRIPLSNGSDHPARVAGCARVYVKTAAPFSYDRWIDGIRQCRTFTTSGPLLFLEVNGRDIGDVLDVKRDTPLRIKARAVSRHPIGVLQVISNGAMLAQKPTREREAVLELEIPAGEARWLVARASQTASFNALTGPHIAHTSAVYVQVDGRSRFVPAAAREWAARMKRHAEDIRREGRFEKPEHREAAVNYVLEGVRRYEELIRQHADTR